MVDGGTDVALQMEPRKGAQAIRRAVAVLRILAAGREAGLPLAEVVQATGLTRPTVHRIVHALIEEGIVERHDKTGHYAIGGQVPELALARPSRSPLVAANEARFAAYRTDAPAMLTQVAAARRRGFCLREVGLIQGTKSMSTWIKTGDHRPVAAITVSAVRTRLGPRREVELAEALLEAARTIERAIEQRGQ